MAALEAQKPKNWDKERYAFGQHLWKCSLQNQFCDFSLRLGDTVFPCHKVVLSSSSSFFRSLFSNNWKESSSNELPLKHPGAEEDGTCGGTIFRVVLKFMYTGVMEETPSHADSLLLIRQVADFYGIQDLLDLCVHLLSTRIAPDQLIHYWDVMPHVFEEYFVAEGFRNAEILPHIPFSSFVRILARDDFHAQSEVSVCGLVLCWLDAQAMMSSLDNDCCLLLLQHIRAQLLPSQFLEAFIQKINRLTGLNVQESAFDVAPSFRSGLQQIGALHVADALLSHGAFYKNKIIVTAALQNSFFVVDLFSFEIERKVDFSGRIKEVAGLKVFKDTLFVLDECGKQILKYKCPSFEYQHSIALDFLYYENYAVFFSEEDFAVVLKPDGSCTLLNMTSVTARTFHSPSGDDITYAMYLSQYKLLVMEFGESIEIVEIDDFGRPDHESRYTIRVYPQFEDWSTDVVWHHLSEDSPFVLVVDNTSGQLCVIDVLKKTLRGPLPFSRQWTVPPECNEVVQYFREQHLNADQLVFFDGRAKTREDDGTVVERADNSDQAWQWFDEGEGESVQGQGTATPETQGGGGAQQGAEENGNDAVAAGQEEAVDDEDHENDEDDEDDEDEDDEDDEEEEEEGEGEGGGGVVVCFFLRVPSESLFPGCEP
eukprot:GCRY01005632.1.p1 GENE.GCRY01005632.1~~GCRY01005632.1.p1  ORF type:complete len:654 (+),score=158.15 GCRY01005632.1:170-2131(+)